MSSKREIMRPTLSDSRPTSAYTLIYYSIGGHTVCAEGEHLCHTLAGMDNFNVYRMAERPQTADCSFRETLQEIPLMQKELYMLADNGVTFRFGRTAGGYMLQLHHEEEGERLFLWCEGERDFCLLRGDFSPRLLRFALWMGYGLMTLASGTLLIHSSCIAWHGEGVLFLGESGTGKSTHTRLWRTHIAESYLLNDDSPIVRLINDRVYIYGSPWSGKTPCYRVECLPLKGCVRLSQAPRNEISPLPVVQSYAALHPSCPPAFAYDKELYHGVSRIIEGIITSVPCYHLACLPDAEAAWMSHSALFA